MRHRGAILLAALLSLVLASAAFAGSVKGTIIFDDNPPPAGRGPFRPIDMGADPACAAKHSAPVPLGTLVLGDGKTLGNVFVQVKNPPAGDHAPPADPVVIDQIGCIYIPHVAGVLVGQELLFKNSDGILHNVHGLPKENARVQHRHAADAHGVERHVSLNKPEPLFTVKCDVHPWMNAYVAVMSAPVLRRQRRGRFKYDDRQPAGRRPTRSSSGTRSSAPSTEIRHRQRDGAADA